MGKLIEVITEIFKNNYKNPRFYLVLISLLMVVFVLYPYIDANFSYYGRMNDRVNVLKQLTTIDQDKIKSDSRLKDEYDDILSNIQSQRSNTFSGFIDVGAIDSNPAKAGKFISGGSIDLDHWHHSCILKVFFGETIAVINGYYFYRCTLWIDWPRNTFIF